MNERNYTLADVAWISGARGLTGAGLGLLVAGRLRRGQRQRTGWALLISGGAMMIPFLVDFFKKRSEKETHVLVA
jgi:hypothetical protein